mgnify:CR=1 FL=1|tara:strand:- start:777 stop:1412 length:636 start_codon:yes stop_codon:yes gene_type:complete
MSNINKIDEKKLKFDNLFSVPIVQYQSENNDQMNKELREIILKKEKEIPTTNKSNQGGWQSEGDFFRWGGDSIENVYNLFLDLIEKSTKKLDFLQTIPMDFHIYGWANVNRKGHSNIAHIHPMSTWSGTYYVDAGDDLDDNECGLFEAFNPNLSHLTSFFPGLLAGEHFIKPKTGLMNLFPSYIRHGVRTYYGEKPRICIAINASMRIKAT